MFIITCYVFLLFFFFKQKTAYEMRISDWSSDVCSSDLALRLASLGLYGFGLIAMLGCSALYNLSGSAVWKGVFRRLDHAAIFLMIAGTYSPFALIVMGGGWGLGVFLFVWAVALCGEIGRGHV